MYFKVRLDQSSATQGLWKVFRNSLAWNFGGVTNRIIVFHENTLVTGETNSYFQLILR